MVKNNKNEREKKLILVEFLLLGLVVKQLVKGMVEKVTA